MCTKTLMRMKHILSILFLSSLTLLAKAQMVDVLVEDGFENVRASRTNDVTYVSFEDNIYRGTYTGLNKALQLILASVPEDDALDVVVADLGQPRLHLAVDAQMIGDYRQGKISLSEVYTKMLIDNDYDASWQMLKRISKRQTNSSSWKADFVIYPQLSLDNTYLDELYDYYFNIAPALEMTMWSGAKLTLQAIVPIATNMSGQYNRFRAGFLTVEQNFTLSHGFKVRLVGGNFNNNRAGVQFEGKWNSQNGRVEVGAKVAGTVQSIVTSKKGWTFSDKWRATANAYMSYYVPQYNTELKLQGNRYVYGDYGIRGDIIRHFGECTIGLYGMYVKSEFNGGFNFTFPLPGKKFMPHRSVRIRPAYNWSMEYTIKSVWDGKNMSREVAKKFATSPDENANHRFYQPDYIRYFMVQEAEKSRNK